MKCWYEIRKIVVWNVFGKSEYPNAGEISWIVLKQKKVVLGRFGIRKIVVVVIVALLGVFTIRNSKDRGFGPRSLSFFAWWLETRFCIARKIVVFVIVALGRW